MTEQQSIKDTLNVIRKALEDETLDSKKTYDNILILDKLVNEDGTINLIENHNINKAETIDILNKKLDEIFGLYLNKWLDKNVPLYLEKYFKNKKL
tara:strand:+ start:182 stop:469 length:288 start_codon:yes stop_codon:yes gene_type:complete